MAFRVATSIISDTGNIKSCGEEVETSVRDFFKNKLYPKYNVSQGHIIDLDLQASPQFDIVISDNTKNPIFCTWADNSEVIYYESVFAFGEIKKSFYKDDLLQTFSDNIGRVKTNMKREDISPDRIECSNVHFSLGEIVTELPLRNPLFTFMFFIDSSDVNLEKLGKQIRNIGNKNMPNYIVFLDWGIVINVDSNLFKQGEIKINLYPEFADSESEWLFLDWDENKSHILAYQYMMLIEHLNSSITSIPDLKEYTKKMFDFSLTNFHRL